MPLESARIHDLNERIKKILLASLPAPGIYPTAISGFNLFRREDGASPENCFEKPLAGLVIQGVKLSLMCGREYEYTANESIVAAVDLPIISWALQPTPANPFLFLYLYLDRNLLASLALEMGMDSGDCAGPESGVSIAGQDRDLMEMFLRLLELTERPEQIPMRAPMLIRELHYILLIGPHGRLLRRLHTPGSGNNQVLLAINWIREHFKERLRVETLARRAGMSTASLHRHFKACTGLSPLQYQKRLRLYEARRLMLVEKERPSWAAQAVGYESAAQFNREYKRIFGEPPLRDMNRRRPD